MVVQVDEDPRNATEATGEEETMEEGLVWHGTCQFLKATLLRLVGMFFKSFTKAITKTSLQGLSRPSESTSPRT